MTAFTTAKGACDALSWTWELRSVNGKGLDLRLRVPDWIEGLEAALRTRLVDALGRGNVTLMLKLTREDGASQTTVNAQALDTALDVLSAIETRASEKGLALAPVTAADLMAMRGVLESGAAEEDGAKLRATLLADFEPTLQSFIKMRSSEGEVLFEVLTGQLDEIERLTDEAAAAAEARRPEMETALKAALRRVLDEAVGVDEARVAQELALIGIKADVTEEIDRLRAHVRAARDLLSQGSPVGRKLDFLAQEFNREANTLCSKAQSIGLTAIGLALKAAIDQMREQVQNVE